MKSARQYFVSSFFKESKALKNFRPPHWQSGQRGKFKTFHGRRTWTLRDESRMREHHLLEWDLLARCPIDKPRAKREGKEGLQTKDLSSIT